MEEAALYRDSSHGDDSYVTQATSRTWQRDHDVKGSESALSKDASIADWPSTPLNDPAWNPEREQGHSNVSSFDSKAYLRRIGLVSDKPRSAWVPLSKHDSSPSNLQRRQKPLGPIQEYDTLEKRTSVPEEHEDDRPEQLPTTFKSAGTSPSHGHLLPTAKGYQGIPANNQDREQPELKSVRETLWKMPYDGRTRQAASEISSDVLVEDEKTSDVPAWNPSRKIRNPRHALTTSQELTDILRELRERRKPLSASSSGGRYSGVDLATITSFQATPHLTGSNAVLSALKALQDKVRRLEREKEELISRCGELKTDLRQQEAVLAADEKRWAYELSQKERQLQEQVESYRREKEEIRLEASKLEEQKKALLRELQHIKERCHESEAEKRAALAKVALLEQRLESKELAAKLMPQVPLPPDKEPSNPVPLTPLLMQEELQRVREKTEKLEKLFKLATLRKHKDSSSRITRKPAIPGQVDQKRAVVESEPKPSARERSIREKKSVDFKRQSALPSGLQGPIKANSERKTMRQAPRRSETLVKRSLRKSPRGTMDRTPRW